MAWGLYLKFFNVKQCWMCSFSEWKRRKSFHIFFGGLECVGQSFCLCRPFRIFSNPESCLSKHVCDQLSHPSPYKRVRHKSWPLAIYALFYVLLLTHYFILFSVVGYRMRKRRYCKTELYTVIITYNPLSGISAGMQPLPTVRDQKA